MGEPIDVNAAKLLDIVSRESRVVALVWIRSCSQCSKFKPVFNQLPDQMEGIIFLRMNQLKTLENLRLSESKGMDETPTMFVYCNDDYVESIVGYHPLDEAKNLIMDSFNRNC
jgi:thioredoxin-like negative regulator of GroEL